jgi:hypothetical protein
MFKEASQGLNTSQARISAPLHSQLYTS